MQDFTISGFVNHIIIHKFLLGSACPCKSHGTRECTEFNVGAMYQTHVRILPNHDKFDTW